MKGLRIMENPETYLKLRTSLMRCHSRSFQEQPSTLSLPLSDGQMALEASFPFLTCSVIACQKPFPAKDGFAFPQGPRRTRSTSALGATRARALHRLGVRKNAFLLLSML